MSNRPTILSVHPTIRCDYGCRNCYLKKDENPTAEPLALEFFHDLVGVAKEVGMEEVALPLNFVRKQRHEIADPNYMAYTILHSQCEDLGLRLSITANYEFFENYIDNISMKHLSLVTLSVNDFVTSTDEKIDKALKTADQIRARFTDGKCPTLNCNILMSEKMIEKLKSGLADKILEHFDSIYLLASKPLMFPIEQYYQWIDDLSDAGIPVGGDKVLIDTCLKFELGLTGGICDKHRMIYVNPYGEIKLCSFDSKNLTTLSESEDFREVYLKMFPQEEQEHCSLIARHIAEDNNLLKQIR